MAELNLTNSVNWARYWGLKCLQQLIGCTEIEAQTCGVLVKAYPIEPNGLRTIDLIGKCHGLDFQVNCYLYLMDEKNLRDGEHLPTSGRCSQGWHIDVIFVSGIRGIASRYFKEEDIPGYIEPKDLSN